MHHQRITVTASVYQRGRLIAVAHNATGVGQSDGYVRACGYPRGIHGEMRAARLARGKLNRRHPWGIVVVRYRKDGSRGCSKPCPLCQAYLAGAGCSWADYYDADGQVQRMRLG